ncbi:MAG: DUF4126 domain-containing protein [Myxococcota bacterium]
MEFLASIGSGLGLSSSAGLNAYIPMMVVGVLGRIGWVNLDGPYSALQNGWVLLVVGLLLGMELVVDKIPGVDTINDLIQTLVRPAAGAMLFAAQTYGDSQIPPVAAGIAGVLVAGSAHVAKTSARPLVTAGTAGMGNWLVSLVEDIVAFFVSLLAIIVPLLAVLCAGILTLVGASFILRRLWPRPAAS